MSYIAWAGYAYSLVYMDSCHMDGERMIRTLWSINMKNLTRDLNGQSKLAFVDILIIIT